MYPRLKDYYLNKICPNLLAKNDIKYKNIYQIPKIQKIVINRGIGDASQNPRILETSHASNC